MDANRLGRLFKGEEYDIDIKIPYSGETFSSFELKFFTDSASTFTVPFQQLRAEGDIIHANIQENDFDLLADGVLRYYIDYIVNDVETILSTNTMHYLKTPDGYSGKTAEDIYNEGYTSGSTDGYDSGYTEGYTSGTTDGEIAGAEEQKALMESATFTSNGTYSRENGYSTVNVNVPQTGHTDAEITDAYNSGYTAGEIDGEATGEATGAANQKALLSAITITENGRYTRENGFSAVTVDVACTGEVKKMGRFEPETLFARYSTNNFLSTTGQVLSIKCVIPSNNNTYYIYDSTDDDMEYGVLLYFDGANNRIRCGVDYNFITIQTTGYTFPLDCVINVYYKANDYIVMSLVTDNGVETVSKQITVFSFRNYGFVLNAKQGLNSEPWDKSAENLAIEYIKLYNITTGGTKELIHSFEFDGEYFVDTVDTGITLSYGKLYYDDYDWKPWSGPISERPVSIDSSYISGTNERGSVIAYENKILTINSNTDFSVDTPYDGITGGTIIISGTVTGSCEEAVEIAYNSGYTAGEAHGEAVGAANQKSLMIPITATTNGVYTRPNGYSSINVNVPQTGHTDAEMQQSYQSGYTSGESDGKTTGRAEQKALMENGTFTSNGTYSRENGYSTVYVNVAKTGHTDAELQQAYNSGFTAGMEAQKALMVGLTATTNGIYTSENGYSSVYVNIGGSSSGVAFGDAFYFEARENNSQLTIPANVAFSSDKTNWNTNGLAVTLVLDSGQTMYFKQMSGFTDGSKFATPSGTFNVGGKLGYFVFGDTTDWKAITSPLNKLFDGCTGIVDASNLNLNVDFWSNNVVDAFNGMFSACTSLSSVPELPATTLTRGCYEFMFSECTSLTTAQELPATTLAQACYSNMFFGCTSLVTPPSLPVTTLAPGCYAYMFGYCTSMTAAPELPATTLAQQCYYGMFISCTSLTAAPELPATTLSNECYNNMFGGCSQLDYIKVLANNWNESDVFGWVVDVKSIGTFIKPSGTNIPTGTNGIPNNWTVVNI